MLDSIQKRIYLIISIGLSSLLALTLLFLLFHIRSEITGRTYLNDGWNIVYNGVSSNSNTLSDFSFPIAKPNDKFVLTTTLPELSDDITLSIPADYSTISVKLNGKEIYEYGSDLFANFVLVGSGYHWVNIAKEASQQQILIELVATEYNAFNKLETFYYESSQISYRNFYLERFPSLFVCIFLVGLGLLLLIISIFMLHYNRSALQVVYIALFTILIIVWFGSNSRIIQLISSNYTQNTLIEYFVLYIAPIPITLFFRGVYKDQKLEHKILSGYVAIASIFASISFLMHLLDILHIIQTLYFYHLYIVTEIVFLLFSVKRAFKRNTIDNRLILVGLVLLVFFIFLDFIRFWLELFTSYTSIIQIRSFIPLGLLAFIICLLFSNFFLTLRTITANAETELLKKLAYTDMLTGLSNRTQMDRYMEMLAAKNTNTNQSSYVMINMDLNRLKAINDSYGHEAGDKYLKRFSRHLLQHFSAIGEIGRVGGDEFLVILPNTTKEEGERLISLLEKEIAEENAKLGSDPLSFSYGICHSNEILQATPKKLYRIADYRMYEMKRKFKNINKELKEKRSKKDEYIN